MTMASSSIFHFSLFSVLCFLASNLQSSSASTSSAFTLPIKKDPQTSLFYTSLGIGTPLHDMHLTIDLGGPSLWYTSASDYTSSSYTPIPCSSKQCPPSSFCSACNAPFKPGCSNDTCGQYIINPLADSIYTGDLGQDLISISPKQPLSPFLSAVIDSDDPLQNLPKQSKGIMGLARTQLSFPKQMNTQKFALCLPSSSPNSKGIIFIGDSAPQSLTQFTFSTPLITNPVSTSPVHTQAESSYEYYINVTSISVYGDPVHFDTSYLSIDKKGNGGTKISTMTPYTKLHNDILKPLVRNFAKKASDRKIRRVESVGPFRACFDKTTIRETREGLDVPFIMMKVDGSTFWGIYGRNLMVEVEENVVCLAFVDGGKVPKGASGVASVVIGGYTLEDIYLEFDLGSSKFSFGDSLFLRNETCSLYSTTSTSVSSF